MEVITAGSITMGANLVLKVIVHTLILPVTHTSLIVTFAYPS